MEYKQPPRILYLDGIPKDVKLPSVRVMVDKTDVSVLYEEIFALLNPPDVTLDCRSLSPQLLNSMLKFLEEYRGAIIMVVMEPVAEPILSRFTDIKKNFTPRDGLLAEVRLRRLSSIMREKVMSLFGITGVSDENR